MRGRVLRGASTAAALAVLLLTGGCWDKQELDTLSIVTGVGIDVGAGDGEIDLCIQAGKVNAGGAAQKDQAAPQESPVIILRATDKSIYSAIESLRYESTRRLFLHHNQAVVFGQEQAKRGVQTLLDFFVRDYGSRMEMQVFVAEGRAEEILMAQTEMESIPMMGLTRMMANESDKSEALSVNMLDFINQLLTETTAPVAPIVQVIEGNGKSRLELVGMAVFRQDAMVGRLSRAQVEGYVWVSGRVRDGIVHVPTQQGLAILEIKDSSCRVRTHLDENTKPSVVVSLTAELSVRELQGFENIGVEELFMLLEDAAARQIKKQVTDCFDATRGLNADIFGFGEDIHRRYPKQWRQMQPQWDLLYPDLPLMLEVSVHLGEMGEVSLPLNRRG
jgi:spore germination protein KC